jgi:hypothetical protein
MLSGHQLHHQLLAMQVLIANRLRSTCLLCHRLPSLSSLEQLCDTVINPCVSVCSRFLAVRFDQSSRAAGAYAAYLTCSAPIPYTMRTPTRILLCDTLATEIVSARKVVRKDKEPWQDERYRGDRGYPRDYASVFICRTAQGVSPSGRSDTGGTGRARPLEQGSSQHAGAWGAVDPTQRHCGPARNRP